MGVGEGGRRGSRRGRGWEEGEEVEGDGSGRGGREWERELGVEGG